MPEMEMHRRCPDVPDGASDEGGVRKLGDHPRCSISSTAAENWSAIVVDVSHWLKPAPCER
jgi:hypothetical protein